LIKTHLKSHFQPRREEHKMRINSTMAALLRGVATIAFGLLLSSGAALACTTSDVTVTLAPVSATSLTIGSVYLVSITNKNNTAGTLSIADQLYLTAPDGTRFKIQKVPPRSAAAGKNMVNISIPITTTVTTTQVGSFSVEVDAVDSSNCVMGVATATVNIQQLPVTLIPPRFTDVANASGAGAIHHSDKMDCFDMMGMGFGAGAGWADYDGDGFVDLFVSDFDGNSHLYHNNGNLSFTETTTSAFGGPLMIMNATGVSWADFNNDGHPDLLVLTKGMPMLYKNNGNGTFTDVTTMSGLGSEMGRGTTAAWGDFDGDGWVDLYITNYGDCGMGMGMKIMQEPGHLYHNNRDGTFTDVTNYFGGITAPQVLGLGFSATWFDFNNDNRPDLYVVNDRGDMYGPNVLWRNDGPDGKGGWIFTDVSKSSGMKLKMSAMGMAIGDYNRDGNADVFLSNVGNNRLLKNLGSGTFTTMEYQTGMARGWAAAQTSITWGLAAADLNNDGYEDVFIAGGKMGNNNAMPNAVLVNNLNNHLTGLTNDGTFLDLTYVSGANPPANGRTVAVADFDADGFMDMLVVNEYNQMINIFRNEGPTDGNTNRWLEIRLVGSCPMAPTGMPGQDCTGTASNHDGIGAKVTVTTSGANQYRQIISGTSLGAGNQVSAHFGLGTVAQADTVMVRWPSGQTQTFSNVAANQRIVITEGSNTLGNDPVPPRMPSP
jgi:hypothetical protein